MAMKKRFIAGAVCPQCQQMDTLRWWVEAHVEIVECVKCEHKDRRSPKRDADNEETKQTDTNLIGIFKPY